MVSLVLNIPEPGQLVDVRQRRYVVIDVSQGTISSDHLIPLQPQPLVSLSSVEDGDLGEELNAHNIIKDEDRASHQTVLLFE